MKKILALSLALVMILLLAACGSKGKTVQIGTSDFSITLPEGYEKTEDDYDEDQIAYYYKDDDSIDFDMYQWAKEETYTLESEATFYAAEYGTEPESVEINNINGMTYSYEEEYEGVVYTVISYMFEDEESIIEICFWTDDSEAEQAAVDTIINTLEKK